MNDISGISKNKKDGKNTSWGKVADWYHDLLKDDAGTYQKEVILPNLLRAMSIKTDETILDLACGSGYFAREFAKSGVKILACDISPELIEIAKKNSPKEIDFFDCPAEKISKITDKSVDKISIILAIQNIENLAGVFKECSRVLKTGGKLFLVLNHPVLRIPQKSHWGFDEENKIQYRRLDAYMSDSKAEIEMRPGMKTGEKTFSFHRPLQVYFKALRKNGFFVSGLEEWISHKKSQTGVRQKAEDLARKEFPMFLFLEAIKN